MDGGTWWAEVHGVAKSWTQLSDFTFTFHFHALEKEMATNSSVLAWRILWTEELGGLLSMGLHRVGPDWSNLACMHALEKEMATHSSILAWRIPGTEEPGRLPSMGSHRVRHDWSDLAAADSQEYAFYGVRDFALFTEAEPESKTVVGCQWEHNQITVSFLVQFLNFIAEDTETPTSEVIC